jgi:hypothetical protein
MSDLKLFPANLELRESTDDGKAVAGLSHKPGGMFLLFVQEAAVEGEPRGALTFVHDGSFILNKLYVTIVCSNHQKQFS